jgi:hypothetical protein
MHAGLDYIDRGTQFRERHPSDALSSGAAQTFRRLQVLMSSSVFIISASTCTTLALAANA